MSQSSDQFWAVVKSKPRRERWAAENVVQQGRAFYLPMIRERVPLRGRLVEREAPLFPNYLFVEILDGQWQFLNGTFGVSKVLMGSAGPARIDEDILNSIRANEIAGRVILPTRPRFVFGQKVQVALPAGGVAVGIYEGDNGKQRETVLLNMLGEQTRVEVGSDQLEAAA